MSSSVWSQRAVVKMEALSPDGLKDHGYTSNTSTGLNVVPKGTVVYMSAKERANAAVLTATWEMFSKPAGSNAVLDSTTTKWTTFRADTTGQYQIKLTITTANGTDDTVMSIMSGTYAGVGMVGGIPATAGQCAMCHAGTFPSLDDKFTPWKETGHANHFKNGINGVLGSYNANCIRCHTTGYDAQATATNGGFDDVAKSLGWTFPTTLQSTNFDSLVINYPALAQVANIGCESCHGPGKDHNGNPSKIDYSIEVGVCAQCHDALSKHPIVTQWENSMHSTPYYTNSFRQLPFNSNGTPNVNYMTNNFDNCVRCHDAKGFINLTKGLTTATDSLYSYNLNKKSCTMCHEPHGDSENEYSLRKITADTLRNGYAIPANVGLGGLCMNCHKHRRVPWYIDSTRISSTGFGPHPNNQADMLLGKSGYDWGTEMPSSVGHTLVENTCVGCHMATPEFSNATDSLALNHIGGHTWAMAYTDAQGNKHDNVSKCAECHGTIESFEDIIATADYDENGEVTSFEEEIEGMKSNVKKALPPYGIDSISWQLIRSSPDSLVMKRALYDLNFVTSGRAWHNPKYSVALLRTSLEMLTLARRSGQVGSIKDIPNDQGKQVQIRWYKFPGESFIVPIMQYGVWRLDEGALAAKAIRVPSFDKLSPYLSDLKNGSPVVVGSDVWTFVGWTPVSGMDMYGLDVATIFDSTIVAGMKWTKFKISGHASDYTPLAWSNVDSGYSVDNLHPTAPGSFASSVVATTVRLTWMQPADPDINYYALYRDTVEITNPDNIEPFATTTELSFNDANVQTGKRYYYVLRAFDFSGNRGTIAKTNIIVLGINEGEKIPTEYALGQNYPNPFNPSTSIRFAVPKQSNVRIDIFDIFGRLVKTLVNQEYSPGNHSILWNGDDGSNMKVASGMYLCRLQSDGFVATNKLLMMK